MAGPDLHGIGWLLALKVVCCGLLLLALTGLLSFSALGAWAAGAGLPWLAAAVLFAAVSYLLWRVGRKRPGQRGESSSQSETPRGKP
jgi:membrane protein implicated in regulation of membrane protease activity